MSLKHIHSLYAFNRWANGRTLEAVAKLSPEQFTADLKNSFKSVRDTLVHILGAELVWLERWKGSSPKQMIKAEEVADFPGLSRRWKEVENDQAGFVDLLSEEKLEKDVSYTNTKGESFTFPLVALMTHLVNHSTYHRGQITTLLRQSGAQPLPTDYFLYLRQGQPKT